MAMPSTFTPELGDEICQRLIEGESLRAICRDEGMPKASTVCKWLGQYPEFREQYARAREAQADTLADEILDIADNAKNDWMERHDDEGGNIGWRENGEAIRRSQIRIDARKWMAGKMRPKVYGDKQIIGSDPDNPLPQGFVIKFGKGANVTTGS